MPKSQIAGGNGTTLELTDVIKPPISALPSVCEKSEILTSLRIISEVLTARGNDVSDSQSGWFGNNVKSLKANPMMDGANEPRDDPLSAKEKSFTKFVIESPHRGAVAEHRTGLASKKESRSTRLPIVMPPDELCQLRVALEIVKDVIAFE